MTIKRVPKQKVKAAPRVPSSSPDKRPCVTCGIERKPSEFGYQMPSLLDPTLYACNLTCFKPWQAKQTEALRKPRG